MKLIPFSRGGNHNNKWMWSHHYTLHGFKDNSFAYQTIHAFSSKRSMVFGNGGKVWKEGGHHLDVEHKCEILWCVFFPHATHILKCLHAELIELLEPASSSSIESLSPSLDDQIIFVAFNWLLSSLSPSAFTYNHFILVWCPPSPFIPGHVHSFNLFLFSAIYNLYTLIDLMFKN